MKWLRIFWRLCFDSTVRDLSAALLDYETQVMKSEKCNREDALDCAFAFVVGYFSRRGLTKHQMRSTIDELDV